MKSQTDNPFSAKEVLDFIAARKTAFGDIDTRPDQSDPPTITEDLILADINLKGSLEILQSFTIQGDLVFRNVRIGGNLDLTYVDVEGKIIFESLFVKGDVKCANLQAKGVVIKTIIVDGTFGFIHNGEFEAIEG